ncbi:MAG: hypothetical protein LLG06_07215 [Desulfobacteraceae bacterium]|nr:hypothetical protein [Desulfobacteraceae bacterium]
MKDLYNNIEVTSILDPVVVTATAVHTDIDLSGFNSACLLISVGTDAGSGLSGSNYWTFTLEDSDDGTTYAAVTTADMLDLTVTTGGVVAVIDATTEDNVLIKLGYVGEKRYLQLTYTETGTCSTPMSIVLVKGHPSNSPVA